MRKKLFVPSLLLAVNECHGIMAIVRKIMSLTVHYKVRHLVLSLVVPRPLHPARSLDPIRFNVLASYALTTTH